MKKVKEEKKNNCTSICGDVNGDGNVDILDIVTMVQMIQGSATATDAADVNDDGMVNILDVVTVIQIIIN